MLWEEGNVHTNEEGPEVYVTRPSWVLTARDFTDPVVPATEQAEHRTHRQNVMEVRDNKVGVMENLVDTRGRKHHARNTTNGEQEDKANRPQHRNGKADRTAPHGCNP